tara:strand:- start:62591 stop:62743 length:153 start_codon:yes stop_codon:yes gene_type:complete
MKYKNDKKGGKLFFLAFIFLIIYLAFFRFDIGKAVSYTVEQNRALWSTLF